MLFNAHCLYKHVEMRYQQCSIYKEHLCLISRDPSRRLEMASTFLSVICKILVIAVVCAALLFSSGTAQYMCMGKCADIPDCDNYCKTKGVYPKGGVCLPLHHYCCCYM